MNKVLVFFIFFSLDLFGQSVKVIVKDQHSGLPVPDVYVRVLNSHLATVTDGEGGFELYALPPEAKLLLTAMGYRAVEQAVTDTLSLIRMQRSSIFLSNNIMVTAQRYETSEHDVSSGVTIVDSEELRNTSSRSTPEALIGSTGVWIQKTNHGSGSPIIRGLMGNQVLLMVDGIRMNNATYRYGPNQYLSTIDPGLIDRIEVTRGNGSVLYGSDALGGVVQILSRTPRFRTSGKPLRGFVSGKWMSGSMEKSLRSELQWSSRKIAALAGFSRRQFGDIVAGGSFGTLDPTAYDEISAEGKLLLKTGTKSVLTASWQHHQQNEVPRYDQVTQGGYAFYNFHPQLRQLGFLRWEKFTESGILNNIRVTGGINRSVEGIHSQKNGSPEIKSQEDIVNTFNMIGEVHSLFTDSWQAQSGVEWYYDHVDSKAGIFNPSSQESRSVRGSYADDAMSRSIAFFSSHTVDLNKIQVTAGFRLSANALSVKDPAFGDQKIEPHAWVGNIGLSWFLHPDYVLFVTGNTGFRAPNVDDVSKFGTVESTVFEIPSQDLAPERSASVELGFKINRENFSGSVTAYRTLLFDLIERVPAIYQGMDTIEDRRVYQKQNVSESVLHGFEAEGVVKLSPAFSVYGNLTYTHGENISRDEPMRRIPPLFGKVGLGYQHPSGLWFRADYIYAGEQQRLAGGDLGDARISVRLRNGVMPGWDVLNVHAGFHYRALGLTISGQNLFDEGYRVYASGVDGYGRNLSVTLSARL